MDGCGAAAHAEPVAPHELAGITTLCGGEVKYMSEGGQRYVFMQRLRFLTKGGAQEMDALLCLNYPNPTYPTKLFLPQTLGFGLNWNVNTYILGRPWVSWSWRGVSPAQAPDQVLAGHLEAFR